MPQSSEQSVFFEGLLEKPVVMAFDTEGQSSNGGALFLRAADLSLGVTDALASALVDDRRASRVRHSLIDLVRQRAHGIALGYADCNDAERVAMDPMLKALCGRAPVKGRDLASQPTLSRFENAVSGRELIEAQRKMEQCVLDRVCQRHRKSSLVTIDVDSFCDPTHGDQQLTLFSGFYDTWSYQPLVAFLNFEGDTEQYLVSARLRPGKSKCYRGTIPLLRRVVAGVRQRMPKTRIRVRLDAGFYWPGLVDALDELGVEYVVGFATNKTLKLVVAPVLERVGCRSSETGQSEREYGGLMYRARSWGRVRRVIYKAEVVVHAGRAAKPNPRFVITNLRWNAQSVYETYCGRGDAENRIKELTHDLEMDRTSCHRFLANQMRVLLTSAAYILFQEMRWRLRRNGARSMSVGTLRLRLLKIGARVVESVRRVVIHLPTAHPWRALFVNLARSFGAAST